MKRIILTLSLLIYLCGFSQESKYIQFEPVEDKNTGITVYFKPTLITFNQGHKKLKQFEKTFQSTFISPTKALELNGNKMESLKHQLNGKLNVYSIHEGERTDYFHWIPDTLLYDKFIFENNSIDSSYIQKEQKEDTIISPIPNVLDGVYHPTKISKDFFAMFDKADFENLKTSPFLIKNSVVTNKEYQEFIDWVIDSIAREIIYENCAPEMRKGMLMIGKNDMSWHKVDFKDPLNRERYHLNWQYKFRYDDRPIAQLLENRLYRESAQRYYKEKLIDVEKLFYSYQKDDSTFELINIYPDTLGFVKYDSLNPIMGPMTNMYQWHNAYDNYPVVNLCYAQIEAFLHWKQRMINQKYANKKIEFVIELPTIAEVEMAFIQKRQNQFVNPFNSPENIIACSDAPSKKRIADNLVLPIELEKVHHKHLCKLGWNVSEFTQSVPRQITKLVSGKNWESSYTQPLIGDKPRIIFGSNWKMRSRLFQLGACSDAIETLDVIKKHSESRPYLGFRYVVRIKQKAPTQ